MGHKCAEPVLDGGGGRLRATVSRGDRISRDRQKLSQSCLIGQYDDQCRGRPEFQEAWGHEGLARRCGTLVHVGLEHSLLLSATFFLGGRFTVLFHFTLLCNRSTSSHCMGIILSTSSLIFWRMPIWWTPRAAACNLYSSLRQLLTLCVIKLLWWTLHPDSALKKLEVFMYSHHS